MAAPDAHHSTHDTKRSEDVRARISLLSELDEWPATVQRWAAANAVHRAGPGPDRNTEWLLYQTLVGAWPISTERLIAYLDKATKEAKIHTSWIDPKALSRTRSITSCRPSWPMSGLSPIWKAWWPGSAPGLDQLARPEADHL